MTDGLKWTVNHVPGSDDKFLDLMSEENVTKANEFHKSFPQYSVTPLQKLSALASYLGVKGIYCKDESYRFGLNAFKVLGGSYAMGRYIAKELGRDISQLPYNVLSSDKLREEFGQATFFTATDGNHGRGVAWAAKRLGQKAVVRMPKGTTKTRFDNIAKEGAEVTIEEVNYDDCVRMAAAEAAKTEHGIIVQDTAWAGYEEIPSWIMQGYGTLVLEADKQLKENGIDRPTHVFVQAGVGSLAGAVVGYFAHKYKENPPVMVVCEASAADCLYRSAVQADGNLVNVTGDLQTIMAGLACGEGNTIGWDILKNHVTVFASCPDWMSAKATRIYANPLENDPHIISGESGSVPLGLAYTALHDEDAKDLKEALKLDENSNILVISTEGDTDPVRYREIVWDGLYGTTESLSE
ncbi:diaminopropionate ammonia-lyase [Ruminococcus sp. 1001136sp1]|uniref:diaminopropionate ammonia-lyase n=1 Tax=unclassified Ruminococcus TaxID=2608920 RepID=UPI00189FEA6C|nr:MULTISPECIES: diaminopropionate ammonia-lyase [unclassified Ruminococcus]MDB8772552.1 diaminopropionate ammonia-lyase [Ruminococcus sp. 1001136sp1]MDB8783632.1 diaminopropionate ammonia-lyase [Ruminococcus sp. 1001136sp1]